MSEVLPQAESLGQRISNLMATARHSVGNIQFQRRMFDFTLGLQLRHPDFERYYVYHVLTGTAADFEQDITRDFGGDDSVEKFLLSLIAEKK